MDSNKVYSKFLQLASKTKYVSLDELKDIVLTWYEPFRIFAIKKNGDSLGGKGREMYSTAGPSGDAVYDYEARGYMVLYDDGKNDYRTIIWDNIYKLEKDGVTYRIK